MEKLLTVKNLVFVLTGGEEDKVVLQSAELLQQHCSRGKPHVTKFSDLGSSWQHQKHDKVYVLGTFSGEAFETLAGNCCLIGPLVVIGYIEKGWEPKALSTEQPVFSLAMSKLIICHTAIGKEQREHLSSLVTLMGGTSHADLTRVTTHLVAGQVGTTKYHVAYKLGKPILLPSWVEDCWNRTLATSEVFHATDEEITGKHKCRALEGLHICVTNIEEATRSRVSRQTAENGGTYCGELKKDSCTHLIVGLGKIAGSVKYKFAKQWGVNCVTLQWFLDSVECGYCLEECNYIVAEGGEKKTGPDGAYQSDWSDRLGQFVVPSHVSSCLFDGCKMCLSGFTSPQAEKLKVLINNGGGTRYNHLCDEVTHMVIGVVKGNSDITLLQHSHLRPHVVRSDWLIECCTQDHRVNEEDYIMIDWSKRKGERLIEPHPHKQNDSKQPHPPQRHKQSGIFTGQTFVLSSEVNHDLRPLIHQLVESGGGALTAIGGAGSAADHHIVHPLLSSNVSESMDNLVTVCWLDCCMEENRLLDRHSFELFHPLVARDRLLSNCVFTVSQYSGLEKLYITRALEQLGAVVQEQFCCQKVDNYLATTHLLLQLPEGSKYDMAQQKGVACVTCRWLVKSCTVGKLLPTDACLFTSSQDNGTSDKPDFDVQPALNILNKTDSQPANDSHVGTQKLLDMFAENLKQATSFTLHRAFPSNENHCEPPANDQAPPPTDQDAELETLHTTRDDILRLQQISKDVVSTKNNRKRGKETVGNSKRIRSTRQFKGDISGVDNSQKTPPPGVIYYDDPMGREEKEKILNRLRSDPNDDVIMDDNDRSVPIVTRSVTRTEHQLYEDKQKQKPKEPPKVLLSSMSPQERILYSAIIEELGGEVCSSQGFSPNCTHVIVGRPSRSEKYLAAIAAGKWVLHTSYLETSQKEHTFVEETPHQWGLGSTDIDATPLAMAAVSWKERLMSGRKGAFEGWRVFLIMDKVKESGFRRLLEAGAASVVMEIEQLSLSTHAFVDTSHLKSSGNVKMLTKLRSEGVTCLRPEYIAEYLMHQDPPPLINQYIVQDA